MSHLKADSAIGLAGGRDEFVLKDFLPFKVTVLSNHLSRIISRAYSEQFGITIAEWRVIALLSQHKQISAHMVVAETPLDKVAVSRAVAGLVERGIVRKAAHPDDRRMSALALTAKGRNIAAQIQETALNYEAQALAVLSETEIRQLHQTLDKLNDRVRQMRGQHN